MHHCDFTLDCPVTFFAAHMAKEEHVAFIPRAADRSRIITWRIKTKPNL